MTSEQPPPGTGTKPVRGEPTEAEYTRVAQALLAAMPANLTQRQTAVILAGALVGAWRHGYWAGGRGKGAPDDDAEHAG